MQTKTVLKTVRNVVKTERQARGYTVADLAALRKCGVSERTIRRIENFTGKGYNPTLDTLVKLANGLNTSVDNLVKHLRG